MKSGTNNISTHAVGGHHDNLAWGATAALASILLFSTMDATVKWLGAGYPVHQIMFFRCTIALVPILIILYRSGGWVVLRTDRPILHIVRSFIGMLAMSCAFYGFTSMPLADAASIFYTAPLLAVALSVPILGEHVGIRRWLAVSIGLVGVLVIIRPGGEVFNLGGMAMLVAAVFVGIATNVVRLLNATDPPIAITFYFTLSGSILTTIACLMLDWVVPDWQDLLLLMCVGVLGGLAQYTLTLSYRYGEVGLLAPLKYLSIVFGAVLGYAIWSEIPDTATFAGMAMIIACGIYTMRREAQLARRKGKELETPIFVEK